MNHHDTLLFIHYACIPPLCTKYLTYTLTAIVSLWYSVDPIQTNTWDADYVQNIMFVTRNITTISKCNRIFWQYECPSNRCTIYRDSDFSPIDNILRLNPSNSPITVMVQYLSGTAVSWCCNNFTPCWHTLTVAHTRSSFWDVIYSSTYSLSSSQCTSSLTTIVAHCHNSCSSHKFFGSIRLYWIIVEHP